MSPALCCPLCGSVLFTTDTCPRRRAYAHAIQSHPGLSCRELSILADEIAQEMVLPL